MFGLRTWLVLVGMGAIIRLLGAPVQVVLPPGTDEWLIEGSATDRWLIEGSATDVWLIE